MLKTFFYAVIVLFFVYPYSFALDVKDEIISLTKEVTKFEKEVPFFTKSKLIVFLKYDNKNYDGCFFGVYLNENLVKTGFIKVGEFPVNKELYIGDYPVKSGINVVKIRLTKDEKEIQKRFQIDIPAYRRVGINFLLTETPLKPRIVTQAWVVE